MASSGVTRRVGVFGGTFDPVHIGHIAVAAAVLQALELDEVLFVVTSDQWLRESPPIASAEDRLNMVRLAVENVPEFTASDVDIVREGSTYTVDTLTDLSWQLGASTELHLIVGADSALSMDRWKDADRIAELAKIVAVGRPGLAFDASSLDKSHPASGAEYVEGPMMNVSATLLRDHLRDETSIAELTSPAVVEYINSNGLYR